MGENETVGRRRIVLHPRTASARRVDRRRTHGSQVRGFTVPDDEVFALVDAQRRVAIGYLLALLVPAGLSLMALVFVPGLVDVRLRGIPLPWLLIGPVLLLSIVLTAWRHDRRALRTEQQWSEANKPASSPGNDR